DIIGLVLTERLAGVISDGLVKRLEEVAVVDDVAVDLVVAIKSVDPADRLEQAMVAHLLVDVQVRRTWGIKARQKLVDDDEQPHLTGFIDKLLLDVGLELLDTVDRLIRILAEVIGEHLPIYLVLA